MLPASFWPQQNWNWQQQRYIAFGVWEIVDKCYVIERLPVIPDDKVRTDSIRIAIVGEKHLELGTMKAYRNIPCIKDENWIDPTNPQVHASNHPLVLNGMDVQICSSQFVVDDSGIGGTGHSVKSPMNTDST